MANELKKYDPRQTKTDREIVNMYMATYTKSEIATKLNVTIEHVTEVIDLAAGDDDIISMEEIKWND